jgi:hypothetical protein
MSGVKTEMTGTMLSWMQDHGADGILAIGPPPPDPVTLCGLSLCC